MNARVVLFQHYMLTCDNSATVKWGNFGHFLSSHVHYYLTRDMVLEMGGSISRVLLCIMVFPY